jgi:hypothetical protein
MSRKEDSNMTYEKAAKALVDAGLLDQADVGAAIAALGSPSVEMTYPAWAEALVRAGLLTEANLEAAVEVMENAGIAEAEDDSPEFEEGLEDAGIY